MSGSVEPRRRWLWGSGVGLALLGLYLVNGDILVGNDSKPSTFLGAKLLYHGEMTFTPTAEPYLFVWGTNAADGVREVPVASWDQTMGSATARQHLAAGRLFLVRPRYYLIPSVQAGRYVSFYGPGPALAALPVYAVESALYGDLTRQPRQLWYAAKHAASLYIAASAMFLFLTASSFLGLRPALLVALVYGAATSVWSTSSQALWQHGPAAFFVAVGFYFLARVRATPRSAVWCGAALAAGVVCRPPIALIVVAVGLYLLLEERRALWRYMAGGAPLALALGAYNALYLGSPFHLAQSSQELFARGFTGNPDTWQTPLWTGLAGVLVSPSRGLLVYSPVLAFAVWGCWRSLREARYAFLRPAALAAAATIVMAAKFHSWWGGWSFGYRMLVDIVPLLALLLVPVLADVLRAPVRYLFGVTLAWSIYVQVLGAFAYNVFQWNGLDGRNVDLPENHARLWSVSEGQIPYYTSAFGAARRNKKAAIQQWVLHPEI